MAEIETSLGFVWISQPDMRTLLESNSTEYICFNLRTQTSNSSPNISNVHYHSVSPLV